MYPDRSIAGAAELKQTAAKNQLVERNLGDYLMDSHDESPYDCNFFDHGMLESLISFCCEPLEIRGSVLIIPQS